jgi:hypothetical protein
MIVLMGLSYGTRLPEDPGDSNTDIARIIAEVRHLVDYVPVQIEIDVALRKIGVEANFVVTRHRNPTMYLNTRENIEQMFEDLVVSGADLSKLEIWTVSHNIHKSGIRAILKDLGLTPTKQLGTKVYDPDSYQPWTVGPVASWIYKIKAGLNYLFSGQVSFVTRSIPPSLIVFVEPQLPILEYVIQIFRHNQKTAEQIVVEMRRELDSHRHLFQTKWNCCRKLQDRITDCEERQRMYSSAIEDLQQNNPDTAIQVLENIIPLIQEGPIERCHRTARAPGILTSLLRSPIILRQRMEQLRDELARAKTKSKEM